eukprot:scaffold32771_cov19-Tisochrysis_lutea.AAC.1
MLAFSGMMYRICANVARALLTDWCHEANRVPDTLFSILAVIKLSLFMLRYLQRVARTMRLNNSSRLHAAFIVSKQAYGAISRKTLRQHLCRISMPRSLLSVIQDMYTAADVEYVLKMVQKWHVCILSEDLTGAVTSTGDVHETYMSYADDLVLLSNETCAPQIMMCRQNVYARKKDLNSTE